MRIDRVLFVLCCFELFVCIFRTEGFVWQAQRLRLVVEHFTVQHTTNTNKLQLLQKVHQHSNIQATCLFTHKSFSVLYEDDDVLVINKPPGISHHNDRETGKLGILNLLRQVQKTDPDWSYKGRLYGVHRLDKVTSGILMLAKNVQTAQELTRDFKEGRVVKYYTGLSRHLPLIKKQGLVQGEMVRGRRKTWLLKRKKAGETLSKEKQPLSNFAKTRFFTASLSHLQLHSSLDQSIDTDISLKMRTLILFRPYTGCTHQLRVAAKSLGLALAGDPLYRDGFITDWSLNRTHLHATALHWPRRNITVCSLPDWPLSNNSHDGQESLHQVLNKLVHKHCDVPPIIAAIDATLDLKQLQEQLIE